VCRVANKFGTSPQRVGNFPVYEDDNDDDDDDDNDNNNNDDVLSGVYRLNRAALHELEKDTADKFVSLNLDQTSKSFRNTSRGIHYQDGIERVDNTSVHDAYIPLHFTLLLHEI